MVIYDVYIRFWPPYVYALEAYASCRRKRTYKGAFYSINSGCL